MEHTRNTQRPNIREPFNPDHTERIEAWFNERTRSEKMTAALLLNMLASEQKSLERLANKLSDQFNLELLDFPESNSPIESINSFLIGHVTGLRKY